MNEIFEIYDDENIQVDKKISLNIFYKFIQNAKSEYFKYIQKSSKSLEVLFDFFINLSVNNLSLKEFNYSAEKMEALSELMESYNKYKEDYNIVNKSEILNMCLQKADEYLEKYEVIYLDSFDTGSISFVTSKLESELLQKISSFHKTQSLQATNIQSQSATTLYHNLAFDAYDEVRTAIKIAKKLLLNNECKENEIAIVTSNFPEYAPLFYNQLIEYGMQGYDTTGTALNVYSTQKYALMHHKNPLVQKAYWKFYDKFTQIKEQLLHFGCGFDEELLQKDLLENSFVGMKHQGILFSDTNKLIGLENGFKHIIFIGTDITHFPPKSSVNFLYTQAEAENYFYKNNIYDSSKTLYEELKRLSENLYLVTATYEKKRKLSPSIILDKNIDNPFEIDEIRSRNDEIKAKKRVEDDTLTSYQDSLISSEFTVYDGNICTPFTQGNKLSASALNDYEECPLKYYFTNVLKLGAPKDEVEGFDAAGKGTYMHECFELFVRDAQNVDFSTMSQQELYTHILQVSEEAYASEKIQRLIGFDKDGNLKENINHLIVKKILQNGLDDVNSTNKGEFAKFIDYFIEKSPNSFDWFKNSIAEEKFVLDSDFNIVEIEGISEEAYEQKRFIKGFIDRVDLLQSGEVNIIDYKSSVTSKSINKLKQDNLKDYQLGVYLLYATQKYPNKTYKANLLSFNKKDTKELAFYNDKISISGLSRGKVVVDYDKEYEAILKEKILNIKNSINSGHFSFKNNDEKVCDWCNYKHICHQSILEKGVEDAK